VVVPLKHVLVGVPALVALATACGSSAGGPVERQATEFTSAISSENGGAACDDLSARTRDALEQSTGKPCPRAVLEAPIRADGEPRRVRVFGNMAQVRYAEDTVFLSRFDGVWLVTAAGCTPTLSGIYDCAVEGG
jgi:hypothetical protein